MDLGRLFACILKALSVFTGGFVSSILAGARSEEHTSELQSRLHLVCRLLLEKKKKRRSSSSTSIAFSPHPSTTPIRSTLSIHRSQPYTSTTSSFLAVASS